MIRFVFVLGAALLFGGTALAAANAIDVGDAPPDYLGRDIAGNDILLSAEPGKVTVITFWATWCAPCVQEMRVLEAIQRGAGTDRFRAIAISWRESRATFRSVNEQYPEWQLTFSYDKRDRVAAKFGVDAIPHMVIVDKNGKVARVRVGYDEDSLPDLVDELEALLAEK